MSANKCPTIGCTNIPSADYQCSGMCYDCAMKDREEGIKQAVEMAVNMHMFGTIDVPETVTIGERAVHTIMKFQAGHPWPTDMTDAATCLAKIGVMLTVYGSTAAALLNNMHERGFDTVTLEDVERVQRFILENS